MLHTLSTSTASRIDPQMISDIDIVIFWQNGVILALQGTPLLEKILKQTTNCYILESDISARGLTHLIDHRVKIITMPQAVQLTALHFPQMNWQD